MTLRLRTLQWTYGAISLSFGLQWLVAPHQITAQDQFASFGFDARQLQLALDLVFGLAMIACAVLAPSLRLQYVAHLGVTLTLLQTTRAALTSGVVLGPGLVLNLGSAIGIALAPWFARDAASNRSPRLDALALMSGATGIGIGVALFARPDLAQLSARIAYLTPFLPVFAGLFVLGGAALLADQGNSRTARPLHVAACFAGASGWLAWSLLRLMPDRLWSGAVWYGVVGLALAALPWLGPMLDRADPHSLRARLAFALGLATGIPLVLSLALVTTTNERVQQQLELGRLQQVSMLRAENLSALVRDEAARGVVTVDAATLKASLSSSADQPIDEQVYVLDASAHVVASVDSGPAPVSLVPQSPLAATLVAGPIVYQSPGSLQTQLAGVASVPGTNWWLLTQRSRNVALDGQFDSEDLAFAVLLLWLVLVGVLSWVAAGWLVRPLQTLALAMRRIGSGEGFAALPMSSVSEVSVLSAEFKEMQVRLTAREAQLAQEAERAAGAASRTATLQAITAGLAPTLTTREVAAAVIQHALPAVGASAATLVLRTPDGQWLERLVDTGYSKEVSDQYQRYPMTTSAPAATVVLTGEPLWVESVAAVAARFPYYAAHPTGFAASAILPLMSENGADGALVLAFDQERSFDAGERSFLLAIAGQCAVALQRARLLRAEQESRASAEAALRTRDVFLRSLAHDLKTPLASLAWHSQILRRRAREGHLTPALLEEGLIAIEATTTEAAAAIDELHDLARLGSGEALELHRAPLDLVALMQSEIAGRTDTAFAHVRLTSSLPSIVVEVDPSRIRRVVTNLLDNATKYSPAGSEVRATLGRESGADGAYWAILQVRDEGRGIPAADLPHIFEPYRRGENAQRIPGEGLGLAIVQRLVELHGGEVSVKSTEGVGSTFTVRLPCSLD